MAAIMIGSPLLADKWAHDLFTKAYGANVMESRIFGKVPAGTVWTSEMKQQMISDALEHACQNGELAVPFDAEFHREVSVAALANGRGDVSEHAAAVQKAVTEHEAKINAIQCVGTFIHETKLTPRQIVRALQDIFGYDALRF